MPAPFYHRNSLAEATPQEAPTPSSSAWFDALSRVRDIESFPMDAPDSTWAPWRLEDEYYTPRTPHIVGEEFVRNALMPANGPY